MPGITLIARRTGIGARFGRMLIAVSLAAACGPPGQAPPPTQAAADDLVASYMDALEARDSDALTSLVTPGNEADAEIRQKIQDFGGRPADALKATYDVGFEGQVLHVQITGPEAKGGSVDQIRLVANDGLWYVAMGEAPGGPGGPQPPNTSTERPSDM